ARKQLRLPKTVAHPEQSERRAQWRGYPYEHKPGARNALSRHRRPRQPTCGHPRIWAASAVVPAHSVHPRLRTAPKCMVCLCSKPPAPSVALDWILEFGSSLDLGAWFLVLIFLLPYEIANYSQNHIAPVLLTADARPFVAVAPRARPLMPRAMRLSVADL